MPSHMQKTNLIHTVILELLLIYHFEAPGHTRPCKIQLVTSMNIYPHTVQNIHFTHEPILEMLDIQESCNLLGLNHFGA